MATWKGMIEGKMTVQSVTVSTESAKLDLPAFYHTPVADLKDLFPTGFDSSPETMRAPASLGGEYRNYLSGRPTQWNSGPDAWGRFVTGPDGNLAPAQVADVLRILYQAWGGRYTSWPFRFVTK
jgi:hypothetical protein